jgi:hypothetical protein
VDNLVAMVRHGEGFVPRVRIERAPGDDHVILHGEMIGHNNCPVVRPERFRRQRDGHQTKAVFRYLSQIPTSGMSQATTAPCVVSSSIIEVVAVQTVTDSPHGIRDFVAASGNLVTRKPATPSLKGVSLLSMQARKCSSSVFSASVGSILGAHLSHERR